MGAPTVNMSAQPSAHYTRSSTVLTGRSTNQVHLHANLVDRPWMCSHLVGACLAAGDRIIATGIDSVETPRPLLTAPHGQSIIILMCPCGSSNRSRGVHLHPDTVEKVSSYVQEPHAISL